MLALVSASLAAFTGAAVVGASVTGLFWLTVVAFAGLLLTGAMAVNMVVQRAEVDTGARPTATVSDITAHRHARRRQGAHDGGALSKAA